MLPWELRRCSRMSHVFRQTWAFVFRDWHLTRRYFSWVLVFTVYALVNSATIALIGVAENNYRLTLKLTVGVLLWSYLSVIFQEISNSISYERWEGTLEYTFMAPVSRLVHLLGVSLFALAYSIGRMVFVLLGLIVFIQLSIAGANLWGMLAVLLVGSLAFVGLGLMAAILPVMSPEHGPQGTNIFQGLLLLVSGIYYPIEVLPAWVRPFSWLSPATYVINASTKLVGIDSAQAGQRLQGAPLAAVRGDLLVLLAMGAVLVPAGLWVFHLVENWAKHTGKLKRTG